MKIMKRFYRDIIRDYDKTEDTCPYSRLCGGCQLRGYTLEDQRDMKLRYVRYVLGYEHENLVDKIIPVGEPEGYRTRMDFVCAFGKVGLRIRGSYKKVVDIPECRLMSPRMNEVYARARSMVFDWVDNGRPMYDYIRHEGDFRYITVRSAHNESGEEVMLSITTKSTDPLPLDHIREETGCESVYHLANPNLYDDARGEILGHSGKQYLKHKIRVSNTTRDYLIGPNTFFQTNRYVDRVYEDVLHETEGYDRVVDLYSGVGTITLLLNNPQVIGVEVVDESISLAQKNLEINRDRINNEVRFIHMDVKEYLKNPSPADLVVLDPPRSGLGGKLIRRLLRWGPDKIVYMSCNILTQWDDVNRLMEGGYRLESVRVYDLFPYTYHTESLMVLSR